MATYEEIYGKRVKEFDSDPTLDSSYEGQVWYNSATGNLRSVVALQAWSSSSSALTSMHAGAGFGTQTDAVGAGGNNPGGNVSNTDEYNGSGWSAGGAIGTARYTGQGCGSQTAGLICAGNAGPGAANLDAEEYNGTSFSEQNNISTGHGFAWMAGIQTAAIVYSGMSNPSPSVITTNSEEYDGSSWSEVGNVNTGKYGIMGFGTTKDTAIKIGGTPANTGVEEYNGTTWTAVNSIPENRADGMGSGSQTAGLICAGNPGAKTSTLLYDGTNWTTAPATLGTGRASAARGATITGNATSIIHHAGPGTPKYLLTEEYNSSINTITAAAWSSGGAYPTNTQDLGSAGTRTAGLIFGGQTPAPGVTAATNEYDGSTFSGGGAMNTGRGFLIGFGTQTAAVGVGGAPSVTADSESYNGSSWSEGNNLNTARGNLGAGGPQTAGVVFGGVVPPGSTSTGATEEYDGTSYTTSPNSLNTSRRGLGGCGTQTAALASGGYSTTFVSNVEEYNGTSWSEVNNIPLARKEFRTVGTQTAALGSSGYLPGPAGGPGNLPTNSIIYDGTTWSTNPSLATGNNRGGEAGTTTASFVTAGALGSGTTTENFDAESTTVTASTLTTS